MDNFKMICSAIAARQMWNAGEKVKDIAKVMKVSESKVQAWIKSTNWANSQAMPPRG